MSEQAGTPLTDAETFEAEYGVNEWREVVLADFARNLERQLAEAKRTIHSCYYMADELAEARSTIEGLRNPPSYRKMDMSDADYIHALEQQLAEARKDSERLDWVLSECHVHHYLDAWDDYPTTVANRDDIDSIRNSQTEEGE